MEESDLMNISTQRNHLFSIGKDMRNYEKKIISDMSLSEKMKIKKEKTKLLLGEKSKRANYPNTIDFSDYDICKTSAIVNTLKLKEESQTQKNKLAFSNEYKYNGSEASSSNNNNNKILYNPANNKKSNKATNDQLDEEKNEKKKFENICEREGKDFIIEDDKIIILNDLLDEKTKKEIKMLRNRISAQQSRDRKKLELNEYKNLSNKLTVEIQLLKNELFNKDYLARQMQSRINYLEENLCPSCRLNKSHTDIAIQQKNNKRIKKPNKLSFDISNDNILNNINNNSFSNPNENSNNNIILDSYDTNQGNNPNYVGNTLLQISNARERSVVRNNLKLGVFSGVLLCLFILGCLLSGQLEEASKKTLNRILFFSFSDTKITNSNITNKLNSSLINNTAGFNIQSIYSSKNNSTSFNYYPIIEYYNSSLALESRYNSQKNPKVKTKNNIYIKKANPDAKPKVKQSEQSTKLARYYTMRTSLESLKIFLNNKKVEFLENISNKIAHINLKLNEINLLELQPQAGPGIYLLIKN